MDMCSSPYSTLLAEVTRAHEAWTAAAVSASGAEPGVAPGAESGAAPGAESGAPSGWGDVADVALALLVRSGGVMRRQVDAIQVAASTEVARRSTADRGPESFAKKNGFRNPTTLIAASSGVTFGEAAKFVAVADATSSRVTFDGTVAPARHPHVAGALAAGNLGVAASMVIIVMLDRIACRVDKGSCDEAERRLVGLAVGATVDQVQRIVTQAEVHLCPEQLPMKEQDLRSQRCLRMFERDGMLHINAKLDPETAAPIKAAIEAVVTTELRNAHPRRASSPGTDSPGTDSPGAHLPGAHLSSTHASGAHVPRFSSISVDPTAVSSPGPGSQEGGSGKARFSGARTSDAGARTSDADADADADAGAASDIADAAVASDIADTPEIACGPGVFGVAGAGADVIDQSDVGNVEADLPRRSIPQMQADALAFLAGHLAGCGDQATPGIGPTVIIRVALSDLESGSGVASIDGIEHPVSAGTARRLAASGGIIPCVLGGDSDILDWGRQKRLFTRTQRLALVERDGGCAMCGLPPGMTKAHHIRWWNRDHGETNLNQGVLLCETCHHRIHDNGWEIYVKGTGLGGQVWFTPPSDVDPTRTPRLGGRGRHHW